MVSATPVLLGADTGGSLLAGQTGAPGSRTGYASLDKGEEWQRRVPDAFVWPLQAHTRMHGPHT